ncbi:MAG: CoA pyrophosphatase [Candidatus Marinimicrobia bacterium CG_4_10_14_0_2_um_filter_48_9]|nr:MAG: CoA pyrophosphatase [Candidatus Marinimicrobia bacterium CG_4_10_14_0_2_um_filter_48_9]PJA53590.1 MAG: CoA pyrophosphatase [Candidatus Marinimicrobia bacterium CG_4_9_14_3_um_filter_48_9]
MNSLTLSPKFIDTLTQILVNDLPGFEGQQVMMPAGRPVIMPELSEFKNLKPAAVLIALFEANGTEWRFPLIQRVEDGLAHSGQIALPGGRLEVGETVEMAALREAEEEIGLDSSSVTVIGNLSPLPIPVSGFLVHPVVGVLTHEPIWRPQRGEVETVFTVSVSDLMDEAKRATEVRHFREQPFTVPYFHFEPYKVWGATAMILSEFDHLLQRLTTLI